MTRVLVPVAVLDGESVSSGLMNLLATVDVTVLGYHVLPEQTPPDQARLQYEGRANAALDDLCQEFRTAGGAADHRLVFTRDREQTVDRIAEEVGARALAITGTTGDVDSLLVSLSGDAATERIVDFVVELVGDRDIDVTLFLAVAAAQGAPERLDTAATRLRDAGFAVETESSADQPFGALLEAAATHDAIVMGENAPSLTSLVFGDEAERVAAASVGPVIVVRSDESSADDATE